MCLFSLFGKNASSAKNAEGAAVSDDISKLREELARLKQERDALAREKDTLAQEKAVLTQEKEALIRENKNLNQEYKTATTELKDATAKLKDAQSTVEFVTKIIKGWAITAAQMLNTAHSQGFPLDPLEPHNVKELVTEMEKHVSEWIRGFLAHKKSFNGEHSKGYGNGSEKLDMAAFVQAAAEACGTAAEDSQSVSDGQQSADNANTDSSDSPEQKQPQEKKYTRREIAMMIREALQKGKDGLAMIREISRLWYENTNDPNTKRAAAVEDFLDPANLLWIQEMAENPNIGEKERELLIDMTEILSSTRIRLERVIRRYDGLEQKTGSHPNGTKDRNYARRKRPQSADKPEKDKDLLPALCPDCSNGKKAVKLKSLDFVGATVQVFSIVDNIFSNDNFVQIAAAYPKMAYCPRCRKIFVPAVADAGQTPAVPGYNIVMSTLASISVLTFYGIPVNTLTEAGAVYLHLGHETIYNNLIVYTQIILEPFYRAIDERLRQCHSSNMDDTPVSVTLNMIQDDDEKNKDKKNTGKKKGKKKKSYVLAHGADEVATLGIRLVIYKAMSGRSREDIRRCLKGYTITDLTVDGYGGYSSKFLEEITGNEKVQIQRCMDHLKRKGLIDMSASTSVYFGGSFQDSLDKLTDGISIEQPDDKMDELTLMHIVMCCYSRISDYESSFRYNNPCPKTAEEQKKYYELLLTYRQLNETPLVKFIEDAMTYLYETHGATRYDEKNRKFVNVPGKFNTRAVTNFMNSKAEFRTFLTRPEISPSNNLIEASFRGLCLLRQNIQHVSNMYGLENLCIRYTVVNAGAINGITNLEAWLNDIASHIQPMILEMALNLAQGYTKENDPIYGDRKPGSRFGKAVVEVWRRHNLPWNEKENTKSDPAAEFETALGWLNEWNFTPDKKLHMPKKIRMWMEVASLLVTEDMIEDFLPWNYVEKESLTLAPPPEPSPD